MQILVGVEIRTSRKGNEILGGILRYVYSLQRTYRKQATHHNIKEKIKMFMHYYFCRPFRACSLAIFE